MVKSTLIGQSGKEYIFHIKLQLQKNEIKLSKIEPSKVQTQEEEEEEEEEDYIG